MPKKDSDNIIEHIGETTDNKIELVLRMYKDAKREQPKYVKLIFSQREWTEFTVGICSHISMTNASKFV